MIACICWSIFSIMNLKQLMILILKSLLTLVHKYCSRTEIFMSLYKALLNAINNGIKWLAYKSKRSNNIYHILKVTTRPGMSMNSTDSYILFIIYASIPAKGMQYYENSIGNWCQCSTLVSNDIVKTELKALVSKQLWLVHSISHD